MGWGCARAGGGTELVLSSALAAPCPQGRARQDVTWSPGLLQQELVRDTALGPAVQ